MAIVVSQIVLTAVVLVGFSVETLSGARTRSK